MEERWQNNIPPPSPRRENLFKRAHTNSQGVFYDPRARELVVTIFLYLPI
uniref:Uncharacterized protein n=1 Tax=Nelumbo nucifera TaxID=4432 RepID=A0A822ZI43_NELNU|nr:TPA_asm: hypothetical protein HUJ06_001259 [Nelumbo nucifera]